MSEQAIQRVEACTVGDVNAGIVIGRGQAAGEEQCAAERGQRNVLRGAVGENAASGVARGASEGDGAQVVGHEREGVTPKSGLERL